MLGEDDAVAVVPPFTSLLGGSLREPLWARGEWGVYRIVASHVFHISVHECAMLSMVSHFVLEFLKIFSINYNFFVFILFFSVSCFPSPLLELLRNRWPLTIIIYSVQKVLNPDETMLKMVVKTAQDSSRSLWTFPLGPES